MTILIAIPCMDTVPSAFAESLLNLDKPEGTKVCFKSGSLIYDARNLISLTAIENNFDYVMWLDSDMKFPYDTLTTLLKDLNDNNAQIISGLYFKRRLPTAPVIYKLLDEPKKNNKGVLERQLESYDDYPTKSIFPIQGAGFGCMLMRTSVLKRVWDKFGPAFAPLPWGGEDISFCYRVKQLGIPMLCDSRVKCGHIGQFNYSEELYNMTRSDDHA